MSAQAYRTARQIGSHLLGLATCWVVLALGFATQVRAQESGGGGFAFKVQAAHERMEMTVNTSRVLEFAFKVPKLFVNNPELVKATPLSPTQVQLSALKPGVTQINVWDEEGKISTIDLMIFGDARELQMLLSGEFPDAQLKVRPLPTSVLISGFVPRSEDVAQIVRLAEDYYPKVITQIKVAGVQQIQIKCKVYEVSRTKLDSLGFDWASINDSFNITQQAAGIFNAPAAIAGAPNTDTIRFGTVSANNSFTGMLDALTRNQLAKLYSEPKLTTISGRPASFLVGGQVPITIAQGLGTVSVQFRDFGTRVDVVPIALGNGRIRLEVRPEVSEIDPTNSVTLNGTTIPGFRTRNADVGVEMNAGETMAIAGLLQNRIDTSKQGVPWLSDLPWIGAPFRRVRRQNNEVELVILVTPDFVGGMQPEEVPECMPGTMTTEPTDCEFYGRGYLEVPKCGPDGSCDAEGAPVYEGPVGGSAPVYDQGRYPTGTNRVRTAQAPQRPSQTTQRNANAALAQPRPARPSSIVKPSSVATPSGRTTPGGYQAKVSDEPAMIGPSGYESLR